MTSFATSMTGLGAWVPVYGSPTVTLAHLAHDCRNKDKGWLSREVMSRASSVGSVGVAAVECVSHMLMSAGICAGVVGRVMVRTVNRFLAGTVAAVWILVYGSTLTLDVTVWLRRVFVSIVLFSRDISITWEHWMERRVAATDLLWLSTRLWSMAFRVDALLRRPFNLVRVAHHANQSWHYLAYAMQNAVIAPYKPEKVIESCKSHHLGKGMPPRPLSTKIWKFVGRNKWKTLVVTTLALAAYDYRNARIRFLETSPDSNYDVSMHINSLSGRGVEVVHWLTDNSFGLLGRLSSCLEAVTGACRSYTKAVDKVVAEVDRLNQKTDKVTNPVEKPSSFFSALFYERWT